MTASKLAANLESMEEAELLPEELEVHETPELVCVVRVPSADGQERTFTLHPGESVGSVMTRNNLNRDALRLAAVVRAD